MNLTLDAHSLATWQSCRRRYVLESSWRPLRWRPKDLWTALLRRAIFALSNAAADWQTLAADAKSAFLQSAADPGLDIKPGVDPYRLAKSWTGMFDTVLATLAVTQLLTVKELAPVRLSSTLSWQPRSWADDSQQLHRWVTVDAWDEDAAAREMHSWRTIGDIAACRAPLMLHVIEIGRATKDGRSTPWSRAFQHPTIRNFRYRFRSPKGEPLGDGWLPYHYNDTRDDPAEWAERLVADGEWSRVTHHLLVQSPTESQCADTMRQVMLESLDIRTLAEEDRLWHTLPMARGACDGWTPCPYQDVCYAPQIIDPATIGLYQARESSKVKV
jgi:hypothetical protein